MKKIILFIFIFFLLANCQKERENIFGKSKETKNNENTCDPVATYFVCEFLNVQLCINAGISENDCNSRKGACYIQRANLCNDSTYL